MRFIGGGTPISLPKDREDRSALKYLEVGQEAFTVPWAVAVDHDRGMWLNVNCGYVMVALNQGGGTASLRVKRAADGWHIWPGNARWHVGTTDFEKQNLEPIVSLH